MPDQGALDGYQVFVDMDLYDRARLGGEPRRRGQRGRGRGLRHGHGERGVDQAVGAVAREVPLGSGENGPGVRVVGGAVRGVVADEPQDTADARVACGRGHHVHVHRGPGPRLGDRRETAPQGLQRGQFRGDVRRLLVQGALQRHPHPAEDLRRLPEGEGAAEALRQMVVGVDEARHQDMPGQPDGGQGRVRTDDPLDRAHVAEHAVPHDHRVQLQRALGGQRHIGDQQQRVTAEPVGGQAGHAAPLFERGEARKVRHGRPDRAHRPARRWRCPRCAAPDDGRRR